MASLSVSISFWIAISVLGCLLNLSDAGQYHKSGQTSRGGIVIRYKKLKFSMIISGQRQCRLQETIGWKMFREMTYCDTGITVVDPLDDTIDKYSKTVFQNMPLSPEEQNMQRTWAQTAGSGDNATQSTAFSYFSLTRRRFCAHRAILATRSAFFARQISTALRGQPSQTQRHVYLNINYIPPIVFEQVLQYLYTYQIDGFEPGKHIIDLFVAAYLMELNELTESIYDYMLNEMERSIEQVDKIITWIDWAIDRRNDRLRNILIKVLRRLLGLENEERWLEFGQHICRITNQALTTPLYNRASGDTRNI